MLLAIHSFSFQCRFLVRRQVGVYVEVHEEDEEEDAVRGDVVGELPGEPAVVVEEQLEAVHTKGDELRHLHLGQVLLPPDVFLKESRDPK